MVWLRIGILAGGCIMLTASLAQAGNGDYGNFWNWGKHYKGYVKSVPIPATEVLFGLGFAALAWIGPNIRKRG